MGLDCSHGAFHGSYSAFNCFRQAIAKAAEGSYPPHDPTELDDNGYHLDNALWYCDKRYTQETHPGLYLFLNHSDCDGVFTPEECLQVAHDLQEFLPALKKMGLGVGHIAQQNGYEQVLQQFIRGCQDAGENSECLEFG